METITSDWGEWLPRAIADADPDGVAVWYLGCNGFAITDGEHTIWIDPYLGTGDPPRTIRMIPVPFHPADVTSADAVLVTHEHTDHAHGPSQAPILAETGAEMYAPDDSLAVAAEEGWTEQWAVTDHQLTEVAAGDEFEVGQFTIHTVSVNDPDATHPVGYVLAHEAGTIFHGGDTKPTERFERLGREYEIDLAVVAFGSEGMIPNKQTREPEHKRWYCDEADAARVARQLQADRLLPTHWDTWKGMTADPTALHDHVRSFRFPRRLEIVEIGDRVEL